MDIWNKNYYHLFLPIEEQKEVNTEFTSKLNDTILKEIVNQIPEDWLQWEDGAIAPEEIKEVYFQFLSIRLSNSNLFLKQAQDARKTLI